jgi:hypothetical protein
MHWATLRKSLRPEKTSIMLESDINNEEANLTSGVSMDSALSQQFNNFMMRNKEEEDHASNTATTVSLDHSAIYSLSPQAEIDATRVALENDGGISTTTDGWKSLSLFKPSKPPKSRLKRELRRVSSAAYVIRTLVIIKIKIKTKIIVILILIIETCFHLNMKVTKYALKLPLYLSIHIHHHLYTLE